MIGIFLMKLAGSGSRQALSGTQLIRAVLGSEISAIEHGQALVLFICLPFSFHCLLQKFGNDVILQALL